MTHFENSPCLLRAADSVTVSVVSHGHGEMLLGLLQQLVGMQEVQKIVVTLNIAESIDIAQDDRILVIRNAQPLGFGANHNAAFRHCETNYFCVLNPDISMERNIFATLLPYLANENVGVIAPEVRSPAGAVEDSIRRFPTLGAIVKKVFGVVEAEYVAQRAQSTFYPDWVAGMFMLFPAKAYASVGGFDERYFLYYEDVDICVRLWRKRLAVQACLQVSVIHDARRASHQSLRYLRWHVTSISRYFLRYAFRLPQSGSMNKRVNPHQTLQE